MGRSSSGWRLSLPSVGSPPAVGEAASTDKDPNVRPTEGDVRSIGGGRPASEASTLEVLRERDRRFEEAISATRNFADRLSRFSPGRLGCFEVDPNDFGRLAKALASKASSFNPIWRRDSDWNRFSRLSVSTEGCWLLGDDESEYELLPLRIFCYKFNDPRRCAVIIETQQQEKVFATDTGESYDGFENVGVLRGRLIEASELRDGYATIDGRVRSVKGAKLRLRCVRRDFFLLATHFSSVMALSSDKLIAQLHEKLHGSKQIQISDLAPIRDLRRHEIYSGGL